ncbi:Hsp20 family protein [Paracoccus kondratievae]|uniref:Heat-shock protein IbpA n=1 Tax=Paracoccus kondratievae TaxID=135740 RepID=A0AAD3RVR5_9RHOB|nr:MULTISPECIES: Hsp20 family protein [Paracoccus]QFQ88193.1 Hsp20 family protein [Paracoccus kondratievae]GLK65969.1 heat-shock protein IbpA [Paracoccus kondratievae]SMG44271.1 molecular chaperone IbpA [Paracoccus sp. J56]
MRNFDLTPLYRATVGFDRMVDVMDRALSADIASYPPYNIEKTGENSYCISLAVAGFSADDLNVEVRDGAVIVSGRKAAEDENRTFLHRGIATRAFERRFTLADHVRVEGASHADGMLNIDLVREVPEALKPRRIEIAKQGTSIEKLDA